MNTQTILPVILAIIIVIVVLLIISTAARGLRSRRLKEKFGPEYDYMMDKAGDRRAAEEDLQEREKRVNELNVHPLRDDEIERYHNEWVEIQAGFVENPLASTERANREITEVMIARGFPVADYEERTEDLSVLYPDFVPGYREANEILSRSHADGVPTEELRKAIVKLHSLFDELLGFVHQYDREQEVSS